MASSAAVARPTVLTRASGSGLLLRAASIGLGASLFVALAVPLLFVLAASVHGPKGQFVGAEHFAAYFAAPGAWRTIGNTVWVGVLSTLVTVPLAFLYAYAIHRSCMPAKGFFRAVAMVPLLTPSLLFALSLVLLFGNKGLLRELLMGHSIYGLIGIVVGMSFAHFPHTFMVISAALTLADRRLYEAAEALGTSRRRIFFTVTLPAARYGLISACIVSFMLSITDFGIPKVIGGSYSVLSTDIYKQVIGQQNFEMGAVVSVLLLLGAALSFALARLVDRRRVAALSARAVPYAPRPSRGFDLAMLMFCSAVALCIVGVLAVAVYSSFIRFWPYNLNFTLKHYDFDLAAGGGWQAYRNSLTLAGWTALLGTAVVFVGAYIVEKTREPAVLRRLIQVLAATPMAVPGLVLGLAYIFFFNKPGNPLGVLYGTMAILVLVTIVHFYSVTHFTMVTALRQLDPEFEAVSDSLKASRLRTLWRVTVPLCLPAILDVSIYFFLSAMTTVSAVVFLYSTQTNLAAIAVINMDDAGEFAHAIAMACVISATCIAARVVHLALTRGIERRTQAWRTPS